MARLISSAKKTEKERKLSKLEIEMANVGLQMLRNVSYERYFALLEKFRSLQKEIDHIDRT